MKLPQRIDIIDTTLRDGLQNEERYIPLEDRLHFVVALLDAGVRRIEVGSLSHAEYVPQFRDIDAFLLTLPRRKEIEYTVLALNTKACQRVAALKAKGAQIDRVLTGQIATSEAYARKNMNRTHEELFAEAEQNVKLLHNAGVTRVVGNIGTIFGCPVAGAVPIERAYAFADRMFDMGFDEIEHSDPDGKATPLDIYNYFSVVLKNHPDSSRHSLHIHDIRGAGMACYLTAMELGVVVFDCALGGIGGQVANMLDGVPVKGAGKYYLDARRTGLVCTEDFATMANAMGIETGIDEQRLYSLGLRLEQVLGRRLHSFTSAIRHTNEEEAR